MTGQDMGTGRVGKSSAVILIQALNSISTVLQMAVFALTLPRADFDDYAAACQVRVQVPLGGRAFLPHTSVQGVQLTDLG